MFQSSAIENDPGARDGIDPAVSCVVIHHRNLDVLPRTLESIQRQGVDPRRIVVVDNSEGVIDDGELADVLDPRMVLERIPNRGYGDAANHGVSLLLEPETPPEFILIATHEVQPEEGAVELLTEALVADRRRMVVGPRLLSELPDGSIRQSCGGVRSRLLGVPVHRTCSGGEAGVVEREWLDGAFALYRSSFLRENAFRNEFFLYYEESELHCRLPSRSGAVACVAGAVVREAASGVPPYLRGRNLQWLLQLHGRPWQRALALPWLLLKLSAKVLLRKSTVDELRQTFVGWRFAVGHPLDGRPAARR